VEIFFCCGNCKLYNTFADHNFFKCNPRCNNLFTLNIKVIYKSFFFTHLLVTTSETKLNDSFSHHKKKCSLTCASLYFFPMMMLFFVQYIFHRYLFAFLCTLYNVCMMCVTYNFIVNSKKCRIFPN
jgi:hypothetical protein